MLSGRQTAAAEHAPLTDGVDGNHPFGVPEISVTPNFGANVQRNRSVRSSVLIGMAEGPKPLGTLRRAAPIAGRASPSHAGAMHENRLRAAATTAANASSPDRHGKVAASDPVPPEPDDHAEWASAVSGTIPTATIPARQQQPLPVSRIAGGPPEEERPPVCPRCHKRLVILSTQWVRTASGSSVRRQFWGCPRGHAMAYRTNGAFGPVELLDDALD